jgi:hypothetical protein
MLGLSEATQLAAIVAVLVTVALAVALFSTNPVVDVADEMTTPMSSVEAEARIGEALAVVPGVTVRQVLPGTRTIVYRHPPRYSVLLGILTLPLGLLVLLFVRETLLLTVSVARVEGGTRILVAGRAHRKLSSALGEALQSLVAPRAVDA